MDYGRNVGLDGRIIEMRQALSEMDYGRNVGHAGHLEKYPAGSLKWTMVEMSAFSKRASFRTSQSSEMNYGRNVGKLSEPFIREFKKSEMDYGRNVG